MEISNVVRGFVVSLFLTMSMSAQASPPAVPGTEGVTALFPLQSKIAAYDDTRGELRIYSRRGDTLYESAPALSARSVWGVAEIPEGLLVATGLGKKSLEASLVLTLYPSGGGSPKVVFENRGERNQASYLRYTEGKVWFTYFESKYITKTGYFEPQASAPWTFREVASFRLGDVTDVRGDAIVIGRPYGEVVGQDGDLHIIRAGERTLLPSYRGVRSAHFFGSSADPQIVIGDGWHQNYGQFAQGRVSILTKNTVSGRYALEVIDNDPRQYGFSKFFDYVRGGETYLVGVGNKEVVLYGPSPRWPRSTIYQFQDPNVLVDVALVEVAADGAWIAVADRGIRLKSVL